jgi:hypothetical protein
MGKEKLRIFIIVGVFVFVGFFVWGLTSLLKNTNSIEDREIPEYEADDIEYRIIVAGHAYGLAGKDNPGFHPPFTAAIINEVNDLDPNYLFLLGDALYRSTEKDWGEVKSDLNPLQSEVYFVAGNHEYTDIELFKEEANETYFSMDVGDDKLIVLDTLRDKWSFKGEQKELIESVLASLEEDSVLYLMMHHVVWWDEGDYPDLKINSTSGRGNSVNFWDEIYPLLNESSNDIYLFAGDIGAFADPKRPALHSFNKDNVHFVATGMGGGFVDNFVIITNPAGTDKKRILAYYFDNKGYIVNKEIIFSD